MGSCQDASKRDCPRDAVKGALWLAADSLPIKPAESGRVELGLGQGRRLDDAVIHLVTARPPRPSQQEWFVPLGPHQHPRPSGHAKASACSTARPVMAHSLPVAGRRSRGGPMNIDQPLGRGRNCTSPSTQQGPAPAMDQALAPARAGASAIAAHIAVGCSERMWPDCSPPSGRHRAGLHGGVDMLVADGGGDRVGRHGPAQARSKRRRLDINRGHRRLSRSWRHFPAGPHPRARESDRPSTTGRAIDGPHAIRHRHLKAKPNLGPLNASTAWRNGSSGCCPHPTLMRRPIGLAMQQTWRSAPPGPGHLNATGGGRSPAGIENRFCSPARRFPAKNALLSNAVL